MRDERLRRGTNQKPVTEPRGKRHPDLASQSRYGTRLFHDRAHPCADPYHPGTNLEGRRILDPQITWQKSIGFETNIPLNGEQ